MQIPFWLRLNVPPYLELPTLEIECRVWNGKRFIKIAVSRHTACFLSFSAPTTILRLRLTRQSSHVSDKRFCTFLFASGYRWIIAARITVGTCPFPALHSLPAILPADVPSLPCQPDMIRKRSCRRYTTLRGLSQRSSLVLLDAEGVSSLLEGSLRTEGRGLKFLIKYFPCFALHASRPFPFTTFRRSAPSILSEGNPESQFLNPSYKWYGHLTPLLRTS